MNRLTNDRIIAAIFGVMLVSMFIISGLWIRGINSSASLPVFFTLTKPQKQKEYPPQELVYEQVYPVGELTQTEDRVLYINQSITLIIPKLELKCSVVGKTDRDTLKSSPGLFSYSQLPSLKNANVSIAGLRDSYGSHFYYLNSLSKGDYIYLIYDKQIFKYEYLDSQHIKWGDKEPLKCKEISCVTLISADYDSSPIKNLAVTAKLIAIYPYSGDYQYS